MDRFILDDQVRALLLDAGWSDEHLVAIDTWISRLESEGYVVLDSATQFLTSFGGLRVVPRLGPKSVYGARPVIFDPTSTAEFGRYEVKEYEDQFQLRVTPVGVVGGEIVVCMDAQGRVFGVGSQFLWYGDNVNQALRCMLLADSLPKLDCDSDFPVKSRELTAEEQAEYDRELEKERHRSWKRSPGEK